jgi:HEAT repeat protein
MRHQMRITMLLLASGVVILTNSRFVIGQGQPPTKPSTAARQSRPHGPAAKGISVRIPDLEEQLRLEGFEPNEEGLRQALASQAWASVVATRIIRERKDVRFNKELAQLLEGEEAKVRVEAARALASLGDPKGAAKLRQELELARQVQQRVLAGGEPLQGKNGSDLAVWMEAAGALAEFGDSSGYDVVRLTVLNFGPNGCASVAAFQMPKYVRFKNRRNDVVPALVEAMDRALKQIDDQMAKNQTTELSPEDLYCGAVAQALGRVGGKEAVAKLESATQHKRSYVRSTTRGVLDKMKWNGKLPPPPGSNSTPGNEGSADSK